MEPHATVAAWEEDRLTVWTSKHWVMRELPKAPGGGIRASRHDPGAREPHCSRPHGDGASRGATEHEHQPSDPAPVGRVGADLLKGPEGDQIESVKALGPVKKTAVRCLCRASKVDRWSLIWTCWRPHLPISFSVQDTKSTSTISSALLPVRLTGIKFAACDALLFELTAPGGVLAARRGRHSYRSASAGRPTPVFAGDAQCTGRRYVIAVKRDPAGRGGSRWLNRRQYSDKGFGVEYEVIALILGRQHHGATPTFSGVYGHPNIIRARKSRSIVSRLSARTRPAASAGLSARLPRPVDERWL